MSLAAIIDSNSIFIGYTDDAENYIPEGNNSMVNMSQEDLDQLINDASLNTMAYKDSNWFLSNQLEDVKSKRIREARAYYISIDKFIFEGVEYRISLESLRNLWIDNEIRKRDIDLNTVECFDFIFNEMDLGELANLSVETIEQIVLAVRCYKRQILFRLNQHISNINAIESDFHEVLEYDITLNYPPIPELNQ